MTETSRDRGTLVGFGPHPSKLESRFGRMFPSLAPAKPFSEQLLWELAQAMVEADDGEPINEADQVDENPSIVAGYTYLGQFIDHDITFDPTPLHAVALDAGAQRDFRSPALDLDSLYGRGPADQPYLYDGPRLRLGHSIDAGGARFGTRHDLLRIHGPKQNAGDRPAIPILGDKRNDENKIISQLHSVFIAFHNRIASSPAIIKAQGGDPDDASSVFAVASRQTRWHYQWLVVRDYLEQICEPHTVERYISANGQVTLPEYASPKPIFAYMPVEFAVAAFRFGHSMIRPSYALNRFTGTDITAKRIPLFSRGPSAQNLNGFPGTLPDTWGIDWGYFLNGLDPNVPDPTGHEDNLFQAPQLSYRIDARLVLPLGDLPEFKSDAVKPGKASWVANLAFRNLSRGQGVPAGSGLPSGESVSMRLLNKLSVPEDKIWGAGSVAYNPATSSLDTVKEIEEVKARRSAVEKRAKAEGFPLAGNTPLWYYILREAEYLGIDKQPSDPARAFGGQHLGPVGSRIVAQTLIGLLAMDTESILGSGKGFRPLPEVTKGAPLTLATFVAYATDAAQS